MRFDREKNIEVAGRAAAEACFAVANEADLGAIFDACRNIDLQRAFLGDATGTSAGAAGIVDDFAAALAGVAGALDGEEALAGANFTGAAAGGAGLRLGAGFGA